MNPTHYLLLAASAFLLPSIVLLNFPTSIGETNLNEIHFAPSDFLPFIFAFVLVSALLFILPLVSRGLAPQLVAILASLAISIIGWNVVFALFGSVPQGWRLSAAAIEALSFVMVLSLLLLLPAKFVLRGAAIFGVLNLASSAYSMADLVSTLKPHTLAVQEVSSYPSSISKRGNAYHIVLDGFSEQYLAANQKEYEEKLDGFTFYPRAFTFYGTTDLSMRAVFSGQLHGANLAEWGAGAFSNGFMQSLHEENIQIVEYPFYNYFCHPDALICKATQDRFTNTRPQFELFTLVDLTFQRMMPLSLRSWMLSQGHRSEGRDGWDPGFSISNWLQTIADGEPPVWLRNIQAQTLQTVDDFLAAEPMLSGSGRYTYLHIMLPHDPHVFDADCRFALPEQEEAKSRQQRIDDQFACALHELGRVLDRLKELHRFDDSLIVVHGDHGSSYTWACPAWDHSQDFDPTLPDADRHAATTENWTDQQINCIARPLLLVKPPNSHKFSVSDRVANLLDIAPTIVKHFGLYEQGIGQPLDSPLAGPWRHPVFYATRSAVLADVNLFSRYEAENGHWTFRKSLPAGIGGEP